MLLNSVKISFCSLPAAKVAAVVDKYGSLDSIFSLDYKTLTQQEGFTSAQANRVLLFDGYDKINSELEFVQRYKIGVVSYGNSDYPPNLASCFDPPATLFVKGNLDLCSDSNKWISVVGTRKCSPYGKLMTERLIAQIAQKQPNAVIVSGLAYGVDGVAHRAALANNLKTVAVVAHGLNTIYPPEHRDLAKDILSSGGAIITEFNSQAFTAKQNFVQRNRIVAGISVATILIESPSRGGSLITADLCDGYGRELYALPGRASDSSFEGNLKLLKTSKASIITSANDLDELSGWGSSVAAPKQMQFTSFILSEQEQEVYSHFPDSDEIDSDFIFENCDLAMTKIASILTKLELEGLIKGVRGRMYVKI